MIKKYFAHPFSFECEAYSFGKFHLEVLVKLCTEVADTLHHKNCKRYYV